MASNAVTAADKSTFGGDQRSTLWVVCLCAAWCRACDEYRSVFSQAVGILAPRYPLSRFVWLDVEDHADMTGDLEIENFPSLLIADQNGIRFFGPLTPQLGTITRLVDAMQLSSADVKPHLPETLTIVSRLAAMPELAFMG